MCHAYWRRFAQSDGMLFQYGALASDFPGGTEEAMQTRQPSFRARAASQSPPCNGTRAPASARSLNGVSVALALRSPFV